MTSDLQSALTAMAVAWLGLLIGLAGLGFVLAFLLKFLAGARGGLR